MNRLNDLISDAVERYKARTGAFGPLRAALIDMDGTLYDSMGNHTLAWHRMMTELGVPAERDNFYLYEGMTGAATINLLFKTHLGREATPEEITELYHRKTVYFNEMPPVHPMAGAMRFLKSLENEGVMRVLVTGSGQHSLIDRLQRDFPGMFSPDKMITSADVKHGKPDPEPYLMGMKKAEVKPHEAIVVENAPLGVESGARSGAFTVGLTTGPIPEATLAEAGADIVLPSMEALAEVTQHLIALSRQ